MSGLLETVGLAGMEDRETSTLSGGELQRLAVAAALARRPQLLISDESTAMVDAEGRAQLTALLSELPSKAGTTVVHVTHRPEEVAMSGRTFRLAAGRLIADGSAGSKTHGRAPAGGDYAGASSGATANAGGGPGSRGSVGSNGHASLIGGQATKGGAVTNGSAVTNASGFTHGGSVGNGSGVTNGSAGAEDKTGANGNAGTTGEGSLAHLYLPTDQLRGVAGDPGSQWARDRTGGRSTPGDPKARLELRGIYHTYGAGSPWAQPALHGIDLTIEATEGVLIVGGNGSGKSTLAWIMAGVLRPSRGGALLGGEEIAGQVGAVGLAFQHARLQLQRATVSADIRGRGGGRAGHRRATCRGRARRGRDRRPPHRSAEWRAAAPGGAGWHLARRPRVLVLDEPMAGLDGPGRAALLLLLADLRFRHGLTVVVISHDLEGMEAVCDRRVSLERGHIVADETRAQAAC